MAAALSIPEEGEEVEESAMAEDKGEAEGEGQEAEELPPPLEVVEVAVFVSLNGIDFDGYDEALAAATAAAVAATDAEAEAARVAAEATADDGSVGGDAASADGTGTAAGTATSVASASGTGAGGSLAGGSLAGGSVVDGDGDGSSVSAPPSAYALPTHRFAYYRREPTVTAFGPREPPPPPPAEDESDDMSETASVASKVSTVHEGSQSCLGSWRMYIRTYSTCTCTWLPGVRS